MFTYLLVTFLYVLSVLYALSFGLFRRSSQISFVCLRVALAVNFMQPLFVVLSKYAKAKGKVYNLSLKRAPSIGFCFIPFSFLWCLCINKTIDFIRDTKILVNTWQVGVRLKYACLGCCWWCKAVGILFWHTLNPLVCIYWELFKKQNTAFLCNVAGHVHPFTEHCIHFLMGTMSQSSNCLMLVSWTWQRVHCT